MTGFRIYVFDQLRRVPEGQVVTAPQLARLGQAPGARDTVLEILNSTEAREYPYWRVVREDGSLVQTIGGGAEHQKDKLAEEGVPFRDEQHVDLSQCQYEKE